MVDTPDCFIRKIDYSQRIPDFTQVPDEVSKAELSANGYKTSNLKNQKLVKAIHDIWQYRKHGEIPLKYLVGEDEEDN